VPKPEMTENCRLHTKIFIGNDFYGQRATTIYCGTAYGWENGGYGSDIAINSKRSKLLVKQPFLKKANLCFLLYTFSFLPRFTLVIAIPSLWNGLPAITDSISCDILHQLLVPIYNRCAQQIAFEKRIAAGRASCHSNRIESFGIADWVWQSPLLFKRAG
jgi:hypothetical protein